MPKQRHGDEEVAISTSGFPIDVPQGIVADFLSGGLNATGVAVYVYLIWVAQDVDSRSLTEEQLLGAWSKSPLSKEDFDQALAALIALGWVTGTRPYTVEETRGALDAA